MLKLKWYTISALMAIKLQHNKKDKQLTENIYDDELIYQVEMVFSPYLYT